MDEALPSLHVKSFLFPLKADATCVPEFDSDDDEDNITDDLPITGKLTWDQYLPDKEGKNCDNSSQGDSSEVSGIGEPGDTNGSGELSTTFLCLHLITTFMLYSNYPIEALQFFAYIPGTIWTIQQLTVKFKDHWSHDLHDLAGILLTFIYLYIFG